MEDIIVNMDQSKVIVWLDRRYTTRQQMVEEAAKALQRELLRVNAEGKDRSWHHPF